MRTRTLLPAAALLGVGALLARVDARRSESADGWLRRRLWGKIAAGSWRAPPMDLHVRLRNNEDGSAVAELVNRDDLIAPLQQAIAGGIHQEHGPAFKPYGPDEPENSDEPEEGGKLPKPEVEHLKGDLSDEERTRLRLPARVPREIPIPAGAVTTGFTEDVIKVELFKLLPECRQLGVQIVIDM
jgi:hypothetical protein